MKKCIALFLFLACAFQFPIQAKEEIAYNKIMNNSSSIGTLVDDSGNSVLVEGELIESNVKLNSIDSSDIEQTYKYSLYATKTGELTTSERDGSISIEVYLTINYNENGDLYLLTKVSGSWKFLDRASVTKAQLTYGCNGFGVYNQDNTRTVSNNYSISTGFSKYVNSNFGTMGQTLVLDLKMTNNFGNSRYWTFTTQNNLFNNFGDI